MKIENEKKVMHIMQLAVELNWLSANPKGSYPLMEASETEKCMLAMVDDIELKQMERWVENKKQKRTLEKEKYGGGKG